MSEDSKDEKLSYEDPNPIELSKSDIDIIQKIESIGNGSMSDYLDIEGLDFSKFNDFIRDVGLQRNETAMKIASELESTSIIKAKKADFRFKITQRWLGTKNTILTRKNINKATPYSFQELLQFTGVNALPKPHRLERFSGVFPELSIQVFASQFFIFNRFDFEKKAVYLQIEGGRISLNEMTRILTSQINALSSTNFEKVVYKRSDSSRLDYETISNLGFEPDSSSENQYAFFIYNQESLLKLRATRERIFLKIK